MKFAFCLFNYFPYGGLQRDFLRIARECIKRGHSVTVYTMRWEGEQDPALPVHIIQTKGWQNHTRSLYFIKELQTIFAQQYYDRIVGFNKMPGLDIYYAADTCFAARTQKKHGAWYRLTPRYRHLAACEYAVFNPASKTRILLIAKNQQTEFMQHYTTQPERFHLLPPGISRDRIAPTNATETRDALRHEFPAEFLLLLVGSGFKTKGLDRILLGVTALPDAMRKRTKLLVIGQDRAKLFQRQAQRLGIAEQVIFLGGRDDVPRFLLGADLLLHPAYNENTGTVLLEAVASGLPVLTTDVCGYAHYITAANAGIVLPSPFSQTQFNQTLQDMLLSPQRKIWQQNGIVFAQQTDLYSMPEQAVDYLCS